jgi:RNase P/RNase MRP subunit POP5
MVQEIYICGIRLRFLHRARSTSVLHCERTSCDLIMLAFLYLNRAAYIHLELVLRGRFILISASILMSYIELTNVNDLSVAFLAISEL